MTWSSWPVTLTTTPTPIQRKWRYVAIGKDGSLWADQKKLTMNFFRRLKKMWTTTRSKRQLDRRKIHILLPFRPVVSILTSSVFYLFFWQVEDLAQQAECPDIEVLSNLSEKEVNTKKCKSPNQKLNFKWKLQLTFSDSIASQAPTPVRPFVNTLGGC